MKTLNLISLALGLTLAASSFAQTQAPTPGQQDDGTQQRLPGDKRRPPKNPITLASEEGTQDRLTEGRRAQIYEWGVNPKTILEDAVEEVKSTADYRQQKEVLLRAFETLVPRSFPNEKQTLMRFTLNRARKIVEAMDKYGDLSRPGVIDQEVRVLLRSIDFALSYFKTEYIFVAGANGSNGGYVKNAKAVIPPEYAKYSIDYTEFLMRINESTVNAKAQLEVALLALGWYHVTLAWDPAWIAYSTAIAGIDAFLNSDGDYECGTAPRAGSDKDSVLHMYSVRKKYLISLQRVAEAGQSQTPPSRAAAVAVAQIHAERGF